MWGQLEISAPTDQSLGESLIEPVQGHISRMGSSPILVEPPTVSPEYVRTSPTVSTAQSSPVPLQDNNVLLLLYGEWLLILIFKPDWCNDAICWHGYPYCTLYWVKWSLYHFIQSSCTPEYALLAVNISRQQEVSLIAEPCFIKKVRVQFNLVI